VKIYTGGAVELDRRDNEVYGGRAPEDLDDLLGLIAERRPGRGIYARSYVKRPGLRSNVELLSSLPISTRIAIEQQAGAKVAAVSEAFGPAVALSHPDVVVGGVEVVVRVAPN
jgi:hypothetical protein